MTTIEAVTTALATVIDPELKRPITELGMVGDIQISADKVTVTIKLTTSGCPLRNTIKADVIAAIKKATTVETIEVHMDVMTEEEKRALREKLTGREEHEIPFTKPGSLTRVYAVTSGKGGVGKSSMTSNIAVAMAKNGLKVGVVDADIYGFSIPRMLGVETAPQTIDGMIIPPISHGVKVISIGMFVPEDTPVVWRGPMLHRAIQQFLADVFWGDLDVLLLDLPPGTGDVALSISQFLPNAEILVVTTPQIAAAEVAQRAGSIAAQTNQQVVGVIENMSYMIQPDGTQLEVFGSGGGERVAQRLSEQLGYTVPLLAKVPLDIDLRVGGDKGRPIALGDGGAAEQLNHLAKALGSRARGLAGRSLGINPV